jgi:hypothetical protein
VVSCPRNHRELTPQNVCSGAFRFETHVSIAPTPWCLPVLAETENKTRCSIRCRSTVRPLSHVPLRRRTAQPITIFGHDRIPPAAAAAGQLTAQQELPPAGPVQCIALVGASNVKADATLAWPYAFPQVLLNDAQFSNLDLLMLFMRIDTGNPTTSPRVLHVAATLPALQADVERVAQNTGASFDLPADGGVAPGATAGPWF